MEGYLIYQICFLPVALLIGIGWPGMARACSVCIASDSAYSLLGQEVDHSESLRFSNENLWVEKSQSAEQHQEFRSYLGISYGVNDQLTVGATLPWVWKKVSDEKERTFTRGLGDVEIMGRLMIWRNRSFAPTHVVRLSAGVQVPTGNYWVRQPNASGKVESGLSQQPQAFRPMHAEHEDEDFGETSNKDTLVDDHSQPGIGAFVGVAGLDYQHYADRFNLGAGVLVRHSGTSARGFNYGQTWLVSSNAQYQPTSWLMLGGGPLFRYANRDIDDGREDPSSGGSVVYAEPSLTFRITPAISTRAKAALPIWEHLNGEQHEGPMISVSVVWAPSL